MQSYDFSAYGWLTMCCQISDAEMIHQFHFSVQQHSQSCM